MDLHCVLKPAVVQVCLVADQAGDNFALGERAEQPPVGYHKLNNLQWDDLQYGAVTSSSRLKSSRLTCHELVNLTSFFILWKDQL